MARVLRVVLDLEGSPATWQMAVDEALLRLRDEGAIPDTLRVYVFSPPAVTIGRFQRLETSVDMEEAQRMGVEVVRRFTGGGSVYHDPEGEVTYSITLGLDSAPGLRDVAESYRVLCGGVVEALRVLGVQAEFKPVNDVVAGGRKISGSAQARARGALLQHGTLLYAADLEAMARLLRAPREKLESHGARGIEDRVTTVERLLGRRPTRVEAALALVEGFRRALGYDTIRLDRLTREEVELAERLVEKYRDEKWLRRR